MESKKNKKYELEQKRPLFFGIGMIVSLSLTLVAFEWKSPIDPIVQFDMNHEKFDELFVPITEIKLPPPPPKAVIIKAVQVELPESQEIPSIDSEATQDQKFDDVPIEALPIEVAEETPKNWAEVMPSFEGGMANFYKFMSKNIKYPRQAQRMGVEGRVFVQFVVEKDGSLTDIQVVKGVGAGCDEEALRAMKLVPRFTPGKQGDVRVRVQMVVPINFQLQ